MKTRDEMIYDFMLALAPKYLEYANRAAAFNEMNITETTAADDLMEDAIHLTEEYFKRMAT